MNLYMRARNWLFPIQIKNAIITMFFIVNKEQKEYGYEIFNKNKKLRIRKLLRAETMKNRKFRIRQKMIWTRKALQMAGIMSLK